MHAGVARGGAGRGGAALAAARRGAGALLGSAWLCLALLSSVSALVLIKSETNRLSWPFGE